MCRCFYVCICVYMCVYVSWRWGAFEGITSACWTIGWERLTTMLPSKRRPLRAQLPALHLHSMARSQHSPTIRGSGSLWTPLPNKNKKTTNRKTRCSVTSRTSGATFVVWPRKKNEVVAEKVKNTLFHNSQAPRPLYITRALGFPPHTLSRTSYWLTSRPQYKS